MARSKLFEYYEELLENEEEVKRFRSLTYREKLAEIREVDEVCHYASGAKTEYGE